MKRECWVVLVAYLLDHLLCKLHIGLPSGSQEGVKPLGGLFRVGCSTLCPLLSRLGQLVQHPPLQHLAMHLQDTARCSTCPLNLWARQSYPQVTQCIRGA